MPKCSAIAGSVIARFSSHTQRAIFLSRITRFAQGNAIINPSFYTPVADAAHLTTFACLRRVQGFLTSRDDYTHKMSKGKRQNQALIAKASQRCDILFAVL
ncbi:TPA: hypothetical protein ACIVON_003389 [Salmonella enterica subsp. enterica serovar Poona]|nr:hypothetical protein [Salmonella enterica]EKB5041422.1 hypothetical protein [Salmonella enterica]EME1066068.1 hypothetical protein [Salmonella enterica]HEC9416338.1 hypothetical protein [Salmonella enterica subsp. enterica serovar Poona]